jgi:uncharacterized protein (UPF0254 family)
MEILAQITVGTSTGTGKGALIADDDHQNSITL